jgi:hypothetical protein
MLKSIFNKPWYESLTAWGVVLLGAVQAAEQVGMVPAGTSSGGAEAVQGLAGAVAAAVNYAGALLVILGLRKAANPPAPTA